MDYVIAPELVQVMQSLKPFLGQRGGAVTNALGGIVDLLSTDNARQARQNFTQMLAGKGPVSMSQSENRYNPYTVFLVLVLLLLADTYPADTAGLPADTLPVAPKEGEELPDTDITPTDA